MSDQERHLPGDDDFIEPLPVPTGSRIPDPTSAVCDSDEYDRYFRIVRNNPGLVEWSRSCVEIYESQLKDLDNTSLTAEDKLQILRGMLVVQRVTLERWIRTGDALGEEV